MYVTSIVLLDMCDFVVFAVYLPNTGLQRIPSKNAAIYTSLYRRWLVYQRRGGSMGVHDFVSLFANHSLRKGADQGCVV